jgi:hypothetical protein
MTTVQSTLYIHPEAHTRNSNQSIRPDVTAAPMPRTPIALIERVATTRTVRRQVHPQLVSLGGGIATRASHMPGRESPGARFASLMSGNYHELPRSLV